MAKAIRNSEDWSSTVAAGEGFGISESRHGGNVGVVRPGGVQSLSAGTGIAHSEYNHSQEHPVRFVQMWVVQVDYTLADRLNRWLPIASARPPPRRALLKCRFRLMHVYDFQLKRPPLA